MVAEPKFVHIEPDSELARLLEEAGERPVRLALGEKVFRVEREPWVGSPDAARPPSIWDGYDPEAARASTLAAAGGWRGLVDGEELKAYIRERRKT